MPIGDCVTHNLQLSSHNIRQTNGHRTGIQSAASSDLNGLYGSRAAVITAYLSRTAGKRLNLRHNIALPTLCSNLTLKQYVLYENIHTHIHIQPLLEYLIVLYLFIYNAFDKIYIIMLPHILWYFIDSRFI